MSRFPEPKEVTQLVSEVVGKQVQAKVTRSEPLEGSPRDPLFTGFYTADGDDTPSAAIVVNFPVALAAAGSLAGIPQNVILDDLKDKYVDDSTKENLYEVLNIAAALFNEAGGKHMRLRDTDETHAKPDGDLARLLEGGADRLDLEMTIAPCPPGRVVVVRAAV